MDEFDIALFRISFPEFNDTSKYPDELITSWGELGALLIKQCTWKTAWTKGMSLYIAHQLVLASQNSKASQLGGSPGQQGGIAQSKTVGSASISFDAASSNETDAGFWNLTTYGKQFYRLTQIFGAGAIQL